MKPKHWLATAGLSALYALFLVSCASQPPAYLDAGFEGYGIEEVAVLPIVDRRLDSSFEVDLDAEFQDQVHDRLEAKGYRAVVFTRLPRSESGQTVNPAEMTEAELATLVPDGFDAAALLFVDDILSDYKVMYYRFKVEATAVLVSAGAGTVWKGKGVGSWGEAGLLSGAFQSTDRDMAYVLCASNAFDSLPERE